MSGTTTPGESGPGNPNPADRVEELISAARRLSAEAAELAGDKGAQITRLTKTARQNRMMILGVIGGGVLDVVLTIVLAVVGAGVVDNNNRIDSLTSDLQQQQTDQRKRALCPLYGLILEGNTPAAREAAPDKKKFDHTVQIITDGYKVLGCDNYLEESGKDEW
jgi:hypothetical protein